MILPEGWISEIQTISSGQRMFLQKVDQCVFLQKVGQRMFFAKSWPLLNYTTSAWLSILVSKEKVNLCLHLSALEIVDGYWTNIVIRLQVNNVFGGHWMKMWNVAIPCERQSEECASSSNMPNTKTNRVWLTIQIGKIGKECSFHTSKYIWERLGVGDEESCFGNRREQDHCPSECFDS